MAIDDMLLFWEPADLPVYCLGSDLGAGDSICKTWEAYPWQAAGTSKSWERKETGVAKLLTLELDRNKIEIIILCTVVHKYGIYLTFSKSLIKTKAQNNVN